MKDSWKEKLYASYVSTGQAGRNPTKNPTLDLKEFVYLNRIVRPLLPANKNANIVDLGCGYGWLLGCLKEWGYKNLKGIDSSKEQVALAHQYGITEARHGSIFDAAAFGMQNLDVIFLMDVIEHLTRQEIFDLLASLRTRMSPNGLLIMHMPNAMGIFGNSIRYGDLTHELAFTPKSIHQCLSANGFQTVTVFEDKPIPHGWKSSVRRVIWEIGSFPFRVLYAAECGSFPAVLSQNMLVTATVSPTNQLTTIFSGETES